MIIETDRLILRKIDPEKDFGAWAKTMADESTVRYLGTPPMNRAQAWRSMATVIGHWAIRGYGFFSLEHKEIGWTISPDHLRQGFAIEAARASLDYAFNTLGWSSVIHVILEGNEASIAVAKKLGSSFIRYQQGLPGITDQQVLIYGQSLASYK